jgi:hypothetical protein
MSVARIDLQVFKLFWKGDQREGMSFPAPDLDQAMVLFKVLLDPTRMTDRFGFDAHLFLGVAAPSLVQPMRRDDKRCSRG